MADEVTLSAFKLELSSVSENTFSFVVCSELLLPVPLGLIYKKKNMDRLMRKLKLTSPTKPEAPRTTSKRGKSRKVFLYILFCFPRSLSLDD